MSSGDEVVIAVTEDGAFRILAAQSRETVQGVIDAQQCTGGTAHLTGNLVTAATLFRLLMAPELRVQAILKGAGESGHLVADSHPDGWSRGLVTLPEDEPAIRLGRDSVLQMMRTLINGELHQGMVEAPPPGGIAGALMNYLQHSEQVVCAANLYCDVDPRGRVRHAMGYIVQLLPEAPDGALMVMTERLDHDFADLGAYIQQHGDSPEHLLAEIAYGMPHEITRREAIRFGCACSLVRVLAGLGTLDGDDIRELMSDGQPIELNCDYCGQHYRVGTEELRGLLESS